MKRFWMSWWESEAMGQPSEDDILKLSNIGIRGIWCSGCRDSNKPKSTVDHSICAMIDADTEDEAWEIVRMLYKRRKYRNHFEERFIEERPLDWTPGTRFQ